MEFPDTASANAAHPLEGNKKMNQLPTIAVLGGSGELGSALARYGRQSAILSSRVRKQKTARSKPQRRSTGWCVS